MTKVFSSRVLHLGHSPDGLFPLQKYPYLQFMHMSTYTTYNLLSVVVSPEVYTVVLYQNDNTTNTKLHKHTMSENE